MTNDDPGRQRLQNTPAVRRSDLGSVLGVKTRGQNGKLFNIYLDINSMPALPAPLPAYDVFRLFSPSLTVATYNTDGLAQQSISQRVIPMHGAPRWSRIGSKLRPPWTFPPSPEPASFEKLHELEILEGALQGVDALVIVGYTFGQWGNSLDDALSYRRVVQVLRERQVHIVVIDPFCSALVLRLRNDLETDTVFHLGAYWNLLAMAMLMVATTDSEGGIQSCIRHIHDVQTAYTALLAEAENRPVPAVIENPKLLNLILGDNAGITTGPHSTEIGKQQAAARLSTLGACVEVAWPNCLTSADHGLL